jgi:hydrogenase/urease accessory protein HupE
MKQRPARPAVAAALIALFAPEAARAHLVTTDLGPFYDGALHPLLTAEDVLTVLGIFLVAAFAGPGGARRALVGLCAGWIAGTTIAFALGPSLGSIRLLAGLALLVLGGLGLLAARLPAILLAMGATLIGVGRGAINGSVLRSEDGTWLTALGTIVGLFALAAVLAALSVRLARAKRHVVLRVAASWIAAIGLLMIGWQLKG